MFFLAQKGDMKVHRGRRQEYLAARLKASTVERAWGDQVQLHARQRAAAGTY